MGLKSWIAKRLNIDEAMRNSRFLQSLYTYSTINTPILSFQNLNQLIEQGFQRNADVFSVINWISENGAVVPKVVEVWNGEKWVVDPTHELQKVINRPNPYQSALEFDHQVYGYYLATGNSFIYGNKIDIESSPNYGKVSSMWMMPSQYTEIYSGGWMSPITGYGLSYARGETRQFPYEDVMHIKSLQLEFGSGQEFWGMSPLQAGLMALDRSNSNYTYAASAFKNGGKNGILETEREELEPNLTDEQRQQAERAIADDYKGVMNANKTMVTNASVKWHEMGLSPVDLSLLEDKRATLRDICNIYGISSVLFNDNENSTYNNVLEAKKSAYNDVIIPLVDRYVGELNIWLAPAYGDDVRIVADYSNIAVLQTDKAEQSKWLTEQVKSGQMTLNESREIQGKDPYENNPLADQPLVQIGTVPLNEISFDPMIETAEAAKKLGKHYLEK